MKAILEKHQPDMKTYHINSEPFHDLRRRKIRSISMSAKLLVMTVFALFMCSLAKAADKLSSTSTRDNYPFKDLHDKSNVRRSEIMQLRKNVVFLNVDSTPLFAAKFADLTDFIDVQTSQEKIFNQATGYEMCAGYIEGMYQYHKLHQLSLVLNNLLDFTRINIETTTVPSLSDSERYGLQVNTDYVEYKDSCNKLINLVVRTMQGVSTYRNLCENVLLIRYESKRSIAEVQNALKLRISFPSVYGPRRRLTSLKSDHFASSTDEADILWRNINGYQHVWKLTDGIFSAGYNVTPGQAYQDWDIVDSCDMDGDRDSDIIWRNRITGRVDCWLMKNGSQIEYGIVTISSIGLGWDLVDVEDLNWDNCGDLLWRNRSTGQMYFEILVNGRQISSGMPPEMMARFRNYVSPGNSGPSPSEWTFVDCEDLNADGHADIIWRRKDGLIHYWLLDSGNFVSSGNVYNTPMPDLQIVDVEDLDGDSDADLVLRHTSGRVDGWILEKGVLQIGQAVQVASVSFDWRIQTVVDLNGDGHGDILWRHKDGQVHQWILTDGVRRSGANVASSPTSNDWIIINAR